MYSFTSVPSILKLQQNFENRTNIAHAVIPTAWHYRQLATLKCHNNNIIILPMYNATERKRINNRNYPLCCYLY